MLNFFYLFLVSTLMFNAALKADEVARSGTEKKASVIVGDTSAEEVAPADEMPAELIEMAGYVAAQGEGIPSLKLDNIGITALVSGLKEAIVGEKKIWEIPPESVQDAIGRMQARAEAVKAESDQIPEISEDALRILGFVIAEKSGLLQLGFDSDDAVSIGKGFVAGASATDPDLFKKAKLLAFKEFMQKRITAAQVKAEAIAAERIAIGKVFFEKLAADTDVQKSESGLHYKILNPGADEKPTPEDTVLVHYRGNLIDGTQFGSSYDRGKPSKFPLSGAAAGFGEGLTKIGEGGKIILYIPSELGYGNSQLPSGLVKPGDTLIVECELIEINPD